MGADPEPDGGRRRNPSVQIRAIPTLRRSSWQHRPPVSQVAIPPYRSGRFRLYLDCRLCSRQESRNPSVQIRAIPTMDASETYGDELAKSQSLRTDQGDSDCTPCRVLKTRGLGGLFFQPPSGGPFGRASRGVLALLTILDPSEVEGLSVDFQPACQNGDLGLACSLSGMDLVVKERGGPGVGSGDASGLVRRRHRLGAIC